MPTYEYECQDCSHRFEVFQRITDDPMSACEKCGGRVRKILFPVGIVFKGPGFHITDYRKPEPSGDGDKPPAGPTSSKSEEAEEPSQTPS